MSDFYATCDACQTKYSVIDIRPHEEEETARSLTYEPLFLVSSDILLYTKRKLSRDFSVTRYDPIDNEQSLGAVLASLKLRRFHTHSFSNQQTMGYAEVAEKNPEVIAHIFGLRRLRGADVQHSYPDPIPEFLSSNGFLYDVLVCHS